MYDYLQVTWLTEDFLALAGCVVGSSAGAVYLGATSRLATNRSGINGIRSCPGVLDCDVVCHRAGNTEISGIVASIAESDFVVFRGGIWTVYNRESLSALDSGVKESCRVEGMVKLGDMEPWVCHRRPEGGAYACSGSERCSYGVTGSCFSGDGFTRCFSDSWSEFHDFFGKGESLILSGPNASERRKAAGILQERYS